LEKVSVCMATYNGERFLQQQVQSILDELGAEDELIIVDDASVDSTTEIVHSFDDHRIKWHTNAENQGVNSSFERAIALAANELIFLADQDDIWVSGRVEVMKNAFHLSGKLLITANSTCIDAGGNEAEIKLGGVIGSDSEAHMKNIMHIFLGKGNYFGCVMAFSSEMKKVIFPFPRYIESHDLWIAKAANLLRSNKHIDDVTLLRRVHGGNASIVKRSFYKKIRTRLIFFRSLIELVRRVYLRIV